MEKEQDRRYERLHEELLGKAGRLHERNKKRIKIGSIMLLILPFALELVRRLTDSDKVVFLLIWIFCMFALCAYLIGVEYLDDLIRKNLKDMIDEEDLEGGDVYDDLLADPEVIRERIQSRMRKEGKDETHLSDNNL